MKIYERKILIQIPACHPPEVTLSFSSLSCSEQKKTLFLFDRVEDHGLRGRLNIHFGDIDRDRTTQPNTQQLHLYLDFILIQKIVSLF